MRIVFAVIVLSCCLATSTATFKVLKAKTKTRTLIQPTYKTVRYLVPATESLRATYVRPVSTYSTHVSTYKVSSPVTTYTAPVTTYSIPYASAYVYPQTVALRYGTSSPYTDYVDPDTIYVGEPSYGYGDDHDVIYDWKK